MSLVPERMSDNTVNYLLKDSFNRYYRFNPSDSEVGAWEHSLRAMASVVEEANLSDNGVVLEYQLPLTSPRLDCLFLRTRRRRPG